MRIRKYKRGKTSGNKKIISLMVVPHNSGKVKTLRISHIKLKIATLLTLLVVLVAAFSEYLTMVLHENKQLKQQQKELYSFFENHYNTVSVNIAAITEYENLDEQTKEVINELTYQVQDLTSDYIDKEMKALTVSRSSTASSSATSSFVGKIAELRALLNFLDDAGKKGDKVFSKLEEKKEELQSYLDHLPTYWPTDGVVESKFGNRLHPIYKKYLDHTGVDIGGKTGNPIYAAASGKVVYAAKNGGYGYCVDIDHGNGIITRYGHCKKILVKEGQRVTVGDKIALVGETGTTTGPHLHFEIRINDTAIDPTLFIGTEP